MSNIVSSNMQKMALIVLAMVALHGSIGNAQAKNMYSTNGNNFVYAGNSLFPICWDLRQGFSLLEHYNNYYLGSSSTWDTSFYSNMLTNAYNSGINALLIRDEPRLAAEWGDASKLLYVANEARSIGLDVFIGGITNLGGDGVSGGHNEAVIDILKVYNRRTPSGLSGDWIGVHGFDEPDGSGTALLDDFASVKTVVTLELGKKFGIFLGYPAASVPFLNSPYTSVSYGDADAVTYSFWTKMDYGMIDWYPSMVWFDERNQVLPEADMMGTADLIPSAGNYYDAYTTRDELWTITRINTDTDNDITVMAIYNADGEDCIGDISFQYADTLHIRTPWPFVTTSSSVLSNDCGDRATDEHNLSSAVVCWQPGGEVCPDVRAVFSNGSDVIKDTFPENIGLQDYTNVLFEIGEIDYQTNRVPNGLCTGVIGHSDMRILWCGQEKTTGAYAVSLFGKNNLGNDIKLKSSMPDDISMQLPSNFIPTAAVWGRFWNDNGNYPHSRSGFILYNDQGDYCVVYNVVDATIETWLVSDLYTDLFGSGREGSAVTAYREVSDAHLTPANDQIVAITALVSSPSSTQIMHGRASEWSSTYPGRIESDDMAYCNMTGFPFTEPQDVEKIAIETVGRSGPKFYFDCGNYLSYSYYLSGFSSTSTEVIEAQASPTNWYLIGSMRNRHTRRAFADVILGNVSEPGRIFIRNGVTALQSGGNPSATTQMMFDNMCTGATYPSHNTGAFDLEYTYGIASTARQDVMFANVQSFGRAMQSSIRTCTGSSIPGFSVNNDLLYLTVAPIVHGARGLCFYSLGMALRSGPVGNTSSFDEIRVPAVLTSWGPSPDGADDVNMVSRVHETVSILTGSGNPGAPDFTEVLINANQYGVLDETDAYNAEDGQGTYPHLNFTGVNFIAYEECATGDIYLFVSRDNAVNDAPWIVFPNTNSSEYGSVECFGGWDPSAADFSSSQTDPSSSLSFYPEPLTSPVSYNFSSMPSFSASLLRIPYGRAINGSSSVSTEPSLTMRSYADGRSHFIVSNASQHTAVRVFDLSGRTVLSIPTSSDLGTCEFTLDRSVLGTGLYFVSLFDQFRVPEMYKIAIF